MTKKSKTLILLDGNALIHRAFHALPPLTNKKGESLNAVYGFTLTLLSVLEKFKPDYIAASFDLAGPTFRHEKFADYKATRVKAPDDLYAQIPRVKEVAQAFNIPIYELAGFEADDCVGTLARQASEHSENVETIIVTGDNDALQLVNERVKIFTLRKGIKDTVLYDTTGVVAKYGLKPEQLKDFKGLRGDASDNIPGVKGIGEKTAASLLQAYGTLEGVYEHLSEIKGAVKEKLEHDREQAFLSKELGTIDTAAPVALDLAQCVARDFDHEKVTGLFQELSFFSLLKRLPGAPEAHVISNSKLVTGGKTKQIQDVVLKKKAEVEKFLQQCEEAGSVAVMLDIETGTLFGGGVRGVMLAFAAEKEKSQEILQSALILFTPETKPLLKLFFENPKIKKTFYDAKATLKRLDTDGIGLAGVDFDVMLAAYLLNAGRDIQLNRLLLNELGVEANEESRITDPAYARTSAGRQESSNAENIWKLKNIYLKKLQEISTQQRKGKTLENVFYEIEMPLIPVLARMEQTGVRLNGEVLRGLSQEMETGLWTVEKQIYQFAGREFNINSPKQLQQILFQDLKIPTGNIKKLKTGFSTASSELTKLRSEYPIAALIETYRELSKLKNTYLDVLPRLVDAHSRIHTTYDQAVAATGRLSSNDPNLQNIPARNASRSDAGGPVQQHNFGTRIRSAFEAESGWVLVGADYSQIELRIAAHLSGDEKMLEAFRHNEDIHTTTAAEIHKVKREEVTPVMRRQAKVLNFGIIYGMGSFGLAQAAETDVESAGKFIQEYLRKFSGIAKYMEAMKKFAKEHGFVETELGRRRYLPEIQSVNQQIVRAAERMAINMPVQGLAADITKRAMLAADKLIAEKFSETARMLLQVHDELIFEVKENMAEKFMPEIKKIMESAYTLKAPLVAEVFQGKNWGKI